MANKNINNNNDKDKIYTHNINKINKEEFNFKDN